MKCFCRVINASRLTAGLVAALLLIGSECRAQSAPPPAAPVAPASEAELIARLTPEQRRLYESYRVARLAFESTHAAYWAEIDARKTERRRKRAAGIAFQAQDYVVEHPPKYKGPELPPELAALAATVQPPPEAPLAVINDYLRMAQAHFGFTPELTSEQEFKRRYAAEALAVGLTKDQVIRVYALETGGRGTYDMQSGIDPDTRKGKAISSAVGYAQLLAANSVSELVSYGDRFVFRLRAMSTAPGIQPERARQLLQKAAIIQSMQRVARSVPNAWSEHVRLSGEARGMGIHALNLDADIGPWLQVIKLSGLRELAAKNGRQTLSGAEIELMNLAGPRTGLDMMEPVALGVSTANFFSQGGYSRNPVVRDRTSAELLQALEERMNANMVKPGAIEFAAIFDQVIAERAPGAAQAPSGMLAPMRAHSGATALERIARPAQPPHGLGMGQSGRAAVFETRN